jgi:NADPH:quinone reductase-like Zn-dependent oxidoreductase
MQAIVLDRFGGPERLRLINVPDPIVGPDTVLVRVRAASVNPVDWKIREGRLVDDFPHVLPIIPGWDVAGVVERVGPAISELVPGDEVFGYVRKDVIQAGTYAQLVAADLRHLGLKPRCLNFEEAAAVPLAALTAYQAIYEALRLQPGARVLVHGGSGGVGSFAVQLCHGLAAHVIATASAGNHAYLKRLGAHELIDYVTEDFVPVVLRQHPGGIDAVIDTVGGETLVRSAKVLRPHGQVVSIATPPPAEPFASGAIATHYVFVRPDRAQLALIAGLIDRRELVVHLQNVIPLADAARAQALVQTGHTRGKVVLQVDSN